jgi:hypothetical protein
MSTAVDKDLLLTIKEFTAKGNLEELQEYWKELQETEFPCKVDWTTLFQKVYLHACLKGKREIAEWLQTLFQQLDPIQQIGLRQVFPYGRYLLAKAVKTEH